MSSTQEPRGVVARDQTGGVWLDCYVKDNEFATSYSKKPDSRQDRIHLETVSFGKGGRSRKKGDTIRAAEVSSLGMPMASPEADLIPACVKKSINFREGA